MRVALPAAIIDYAERLERERSTTFARARVDRVAVSTDRAFVPELVRYFRMRERRR